MKRTHLPIIVLILVALSMQGCTAIQATLPGELTPTRRWVKVRQAVTDVQNLAMSLHEAKVIDTETFLQAHAVCLAAREGLAFTQPMLPEGGDQFDATLNLIQARVERLEGELPDGR